MIKMNNLNKLNNVFATTFEVEENQVKSLAYRKTPLWDSVGQMTLIANIEDEFDIVIQSEDIMDFNSYDAAKSILTDKYNISFE